MHARAEIDNTGQGNCMYLAYSISLMLFLCAKTRQERIELFKKLSLDKAQRNSLHALLDLNKSAFTKEEIKNIIEPILGPAMREITAAYTKKEFLENPEDTPVFAAAVYGLEYFFKKKLQSKNSRLAKLIDNDFHNPAFTKAELFQVPAMKNAMNDFAAQKTSAVRSKFINQWKICRTAHSDLSKENKLVYKKNILDTIIREQTKDFFATNKNTNLNNYTAHLNTNYVWGTDENLMTLHRAITGERTIRSQTGKYIQVYDIKINLQLFKDKRAIIEKSPQEADIILNNRGNRHWTSLTPLTTQQIRENLLSSSQFNKYVKLFKQQGKNLKQEGYTEAGQEVLDVSKALNEAKNKFSSGKNAEKDFLEFYEKGKQLLNINLSTPSNYQGFQPFWSFILNTLIRIFTHGTVSFSKECAINSQQIAHQLTNSLDTLFSSQKISKNKKGKENNLSSELDPISLPCK